MPLTDMNIMVQLLLCPCDRIRAQGGCDAPGGHSTLVSTLALWGPLPSDLAYHALLLFIRFWETAPKTAE